MFEGLEKEIELIQEKYGEIELAPNHEWFIVKKFPLLVGWNKSHTSLLVFIPSGYRVTPPDNFYTDFDLRLSNGSLPGSTSENSDQLGRKWLQFSYHLENGDWKPHADILHGHNLLTFLFGIEKRLSELS